jgi:hypothetical protein
LLQEIVGVLTVRGASRRKRQTHDQQQGST